VGVRRRAVRERIERKKAFEIGLAKFNRSLDATKRVVDAAIAEGLRTLSREEFANRLKVEMGAPCQTPCPEHICRVMSADGMCFASDAAAELKCSRTHEEG
jgi:hypothetical protein